MVEWSKAIHSSAIPKRMWVRIPRVALFRGNFPRRARPNSSTDAQQCVRSTRNGNLCTKMCSNIHVACDRRHCDTARSWPSGLRRYTQALFHSGCGFESHELHFLVQTFLGELTPFGPRGTAISPRRHDERRPERAIAPQQADCTT